MTLKAFFRDIRNKTAIKAKDIRNKTAIKANFYFSNLKSMETLSCHSNQSAFATAIKTILL